MWDGNWTGLDWIGLGAGAGCCWLATEAGGCSLAAGGGASPEVGAGRWSQLASET
jgi:hypothetical protein